MDLKKILKDIGLLDFFLKVHGSVKKFWIEIIVRLQNIMKDVGMLSPSQRTCVTLIVDSTWFC